MNIPSFPIAGFVNLTPEERDAKLRELRNAPTDGVEAAIKESLLTLERRYEMSSESMLREVNAGKMRVTEEIGRWLMLVKIRDEMR
jgi:hypothetical protein